MNQVEFNADIGEGYGVWALPNMVWRADLERGGGLEPSAPSDSVVGVMRQVDCVNLACGFHAGDPLLIKSYIQVAKAHGCRIGAHPSYPDTAGFGLRYMEMSEPELKAMVQYQLAAMDGLVRMEGLALNHVKFHGALSNRTAQDPELARIVGEAVAEFRADLPIYVFPYSHLERGALAAGLPIRREAFADRAYHQDGRLVDRRRRDSMVLDPAAVAARVARMIREGVVRSIEGPDVRLDPHTVCFHADTPGVLDFLEQTMARLGPERSELAAED